MFYVHGCRYCVFLPKFTNVYNVGTFFYHSKKWINVGLSVPIRCCKFAIFHGPKIAIGLKAYFRLTRWIIFNIAANKRFIKYPNLGSLEKGWSFLLRLSVDKFSLELCSQEAIKWFFHTKILSCRLINTKLQLYKAENF